MIVGPTSAWVYPPPDPNVFYAPQAMRKDLNQKHVWAIIAVAAVILILMSAYMFTVFDSAERGKGFGRVATINIKVTSIHISNAVTVTIMVNDVRVTRENVSPLDSITYEYGALFVDDSETYTIVVTSEGGEYGSMQDSRTITLDKGMTENVTFAI